MSRPPFRRAFAACLAACLALPGCAQLTRLSLPIGPCGFDVETLQFDGDALTQARCLLRPVATGGRVSAQPAVLPESLAALIGQPVGELKPQLRRSLARARVGDAAIGGSLDAPLSHARDDDPAAPAARYFVLHDTSVPWLGDATAFPPDDAPELNDLARFAGPDAVAHMFVNRTGATLLGHDFRTPWRATQLETRRLGVASRGLFLHIEFAQPRRRDPAGPARNDLIAPLPGFTDAQYAQMALLYAAASARRGDWLIPAFHAALDEGIAGAHDDPQHFEIARFAAALERLRESIAPMGTPAAVPVASGERTSLYLFRQFACRHPGASPRWTVREGRCPSCPAEYVELQDRAGSHLVFPGPFGARRPGAR